MLEGGWEHHLQWALKKHVSAERRVAWGVPDISACVFSSVVEQLAGPLYDHPPTVTAPDAFGAELDRAMLWPLMQGYSVNLVGLREMGMRLDWADDLDSLVFRPVLPFDLLVKGHPKRPDIPVGFAELQLLTPLGAGEDAQPEWVWEVVDLEDADNPVHRFLRATKNSQPEDVTEVFAGETLSGEAYRYRWTQGDRAGRPFLPLVVHHAMRQAKAWDPFRGSEVVFGSLTVGVLQTMWVHTYRDASFPTSHAWGLEPRAVKVIGQGEHAKLKSMEADPGSINLWDFSGSLQPGQSPSLVQLGAGGDIEKLAAGLDGFRASISEFAGVSPSDIQRRSGDPRSGYAISVSQGGLRAAQRRIEPQLRAGDLAMLERAAALVNLAREGAPIPESGMALVYPAVPKSAEEMAAQREDETHRLDNGLASPVDIYLERNPGVTRADAIAALARIRAERNLVEATAALGGT